MSDSATQAVILSAEFGTVETAVGAPQLGGIVSVVRISVGLPGTEVVFTVREILTVRGLCAAPGAEIEMEAL